MSAGRAPVSRSVELADESRTQAYTDQGVAPVTVVAQTSAPVVVRLDGAEAVSAARDGITVTARLIEDKTQGVFIHVTVMGEVQDDESPSSATGFQVKLGRFPPRFRLEDHWQTLDANGQI